MPVIDLKDYLGMPQQAPTQPVFQSTTQSLDPMALRAYDPYSNEAMLANVEGRQRLAGLQRLAPAIQAQQAQLAYDKIGEEARVLRQKQEVEAQVQRATDELLGGALNPESTDFSQQATQFYGRNQLAFLDPRMREAMSFLQKQNQDYTTRQDALRKAQLELQNKSLDLTRSAEAKFLTSGGTTEQLAKLRSASPNTSVYTTLVQEATGGLPLRSRSAGRGSEKLKQLMDAYDFTVSDLDNATKEEVPLLEERLKTIRNKIVEEQNAFLFQPTAPTAGVGDTTKTPPSAPFTETMAKLSGSEKPAVGGAKVISDLTSEEMVKDIESNKTDPVFLIAAINSPQRNEKSKDVAFKYLKELQKDPKKLQFSYGNPSDIQKAKRDIQKTIEVYPALKEVNQAWTNEKKNIESQIKDFAKALSVSPELMESWLKNNVTYQIESDPLSDAPAREIKIRELFDDYLQNMVKKSLYQPTEILTNVAKKYPGLTQDLGLDKWFGLKMEEVLDAYLGEKPTNQGDNQEQPTNVVSNTVPNITTEAEFDKLPIGAKFTFGNGEIRTKEQERKK